MHQSTKIHTLWGPSRTSSRTLPCHCWVPASPSPPPRGRRCEDGRRVVIVRVIKEMTASVQYPLLKRSNYNEWTLLMRANLHAQGLWHAVEPEEGEMIEYRKDRLPNYDLFLQKCWRLSPPSTSCNRSGRGWNPAGLVCSECGSPTSSSYEKSSQRFALRMSNPLTIFSCGSRGSTTAWPLSMGASARWKSWRRCCRSPQITLSKSRFRLRHYLTWTI